MPLESKLPEWLKRVTVVGVGLLGGSVAMSLRRRGVIVSGFSRRQASCDRALSAGAIDHAFTDLATACDQADVIVVASPVDRIAALVEQAGAASSENCLITDVGSTKGQIVREIESASDQRERRIAHRFVAAHPIAGSEKTGVSNATATLFEDKVTILTPGETVANEFLQRARDFWACTGSSVVEMSPELHDQRLASVSHVPHLVASALANLLDDECIPLLGSGWRDMTRVASGDPEMWAAICEHNRGAILLNLERLSDELDRLKAILSQEKIDPLREWLEHAKTLKDRTS